MPEPQAIQNRRAKVHRTSHFTERQVEHLKESATRQERIIARWFWNNPDQHIGPGKLHSIMGWDWPLTSTRRSITNLTEDGILQKTEYQSMGSHGRPEHHWKWRWPNKLKFEQKELFNG